MNDISGILSFVLEASEPDRAMTFITIMALTIALVLARKSK